MSFRRSSVLEVNKYYFQNICDRFKPRCDADCEKEIPNFSQAKSR